MKKTWLLALSIPLILACKTEETASKDESGAAKTISNKERLPIPPPPDGVNYYRALGGPMWDRVGINKLTTQPEGTHWRLTYKNGLLLKAESMRTATHIHQTHFFSYKAGILTKIIEQNTHGVLIRTVNVNPAKNIIEVIMRSQKRDMLGCSALRFKGNIQSSVASSECLDSDHKTTVNNQGVVYVQHHFDEQGKETRTTYADANSEPCPQANGIEKVTYKYGKSGQRIETSWHGGQNNGCSTETFEYNELGQKIATSCLSQTRTPVKNHSGFITAQHKYDENGCITETRYVDGQGKRMFAANDAYLEKFKRTQQCNILSWTSLDVTDGHLSVKWKHKRYEVRYQYDEMGQIIREAEFNKDGKAIRGAGCAYHTKTYTYDRFGRVTETNMYNTKNKLMNCIRQESNWSTVKNIYNQHGQRIQTKYFNRHGKLRRAGWHTQDYLRSKHGYLIKMTNHGKPYYESVYVRDQNNRVKEVKYMNKDGKPINVAVDVVSVSDPRTQRYHRVQLKYDERGRHTHDDYFKAGGARITSIPCDNLVCWRAY